jgi:putative sterol carrier protein
VVAFPTEAWFQALVSLINTSDEYREAAADWEGDIAFLVEAEPDRGREAAYILRAPYSRWREVVTGELDPIKAMMQGKLKVQGDLPTIVRQVRAANELVELTQQIPTEFPDGT